MSLYQHCEIPAIFDKTYARKSFDITWEDCVMDGGTLWVLRQNISFNLKGSGSGYIAGSLRYSQPQIHLFFSCGEAYGTGLKGGTAMKK